MRVGGKRLHLQTLLETGNILDFRRVMGQEEFLVRPLLNSFYEKDRLSQMKMLRKHKLLLLIPAVLLSGIFIGMFPFNMAHRLAGDCPFAHGKQAFWSNPCPFRSVTSNGEHFEVTLESVPLDQGLQFSQKIPIAVSGSFLHNIALNSVPLRC